MSEQHEEHRPETVARIILGAIKEKLGAEPCPNCLRMGIGLALSSVHSSIIAELHKKGMGKDGAEIVIDSVERLLKSMAGTMRHLGIGELGFAIINEEPPPPDDGQKKRHETDLSLH